MQPLGIGLIGTGFMGKAHALAYRNARAVLGALPQVRLEQLCDTPLPQAERFADQFGFARFTDTWSDLVDDPAIDIVSITAPNHLHRDIALAALSAGKHVWCEKPLALTLADATDMTDAARRSGAKTMVGYNYVHNPAISHAKRLIDSGAIGDVVHFRGWVDEDYQADPTLPWTWRARRADAGLGVLGDLACHLVSLATTLNGPIASLIADTQTVHATRPLADGTGRAAVENEDTASALVHFANGVHGTLAASRTAWGRKSRLDWEVHGTRGMLTFAQERMNELRLYVNEGPKATQGFRTILTGPEHAPYGAFCPAPGHQLGFNDLKIIELGAFLSAIRDDTTPYPDFAAALTFEQVIHAMDRSAATGQRVTPDAGSRRQTSS